MESVEEVGYKIVDLVGDGRRFVGPATSPSLGCAGYWFVFSLGLGYDAKKIMRRKGRAGTEATVATGYEVASIVLPHKTVSHHTTLGVDEGDHGAHGGKGVGIGALDMKDIARA